MGKRNYGLEMTPEQFRAFGRPSQEDLRQVFDPASDIARQLREAGERRAGPQLARTAAALPPPANRGGKSSGGSDDWVKLVIEDGKVKEVPKRRGYGGSSAVVDWVNFTVGVETVENDDCTISPETIVHESEKMIPVTPDQIMICVSRRLKSIFGYGVSHKLGYGQHFYQETWQMVEGWGTVSVGGQHNTVLVSISGTGLAAAAEGWEVRLRQFLETADRARITRVDLAHDDYTGSAYTVDKADEDHTAGLFNCGGRNPRCEYRGDWKNPDGKGRSFYVGSRKNGKFCRVYEKGRELGDPSSEWTRIEVEFKSVDRVIPFDILTRPGEYLAAAYPAFGWIEQRQERIETTQKTVQIGVDRAVQVVRHQFGTYIDQLVELLGVEDFLKRVRRSDKVPAFAKVPHFSLGGESIHERRYGIPCVNLGAAASAW